MRALIQSWIPEIAKMLSHGKGTTLEFARTWREKRSGYVDDLKRSPTDSEQSSKRISSS